MNILKVTEMVRFFLLKENNPIHHTKLNQLILLADIECMSRFILGISDDFISCLPNGPKLLEVASNFDNKYILETWKFTCENNHAVLMERKDSFEYTHLNRTELNILRYIWITFGDLSEDELANITKNMAFEWHSEHNSILNPKMFFASLHFNEKEIEHRNKYYVEHMLEGKHSLHEIINKISK